MLTNGRRQAIMYMGLGALITLLILSLMGRLRMEGYEKPISSDEHVEMSGEISSEISVSKAETIGPSPTYSDSDNESDSDDE